MEQIITQAIVLIVRDYGDADRLVTLFSKEYGKITAIAYGARRAKSRMAGCLQPFCHVEIVLTSGKAMDTVKQCEVLTSYRQLRENLLSMAYAAFLAELVAELWPEREPEPAVFALLLKVYAVMTERNPRITSLACAWQLFALAGFKPELKTCVKCERQVNFPAYFDAEAGGAVCQDCSDGDCLSLPEILYVFLWRLLTLDWTNPTPFTVNGATLLQAETIFTRFLQYRLDKPLKSMAFIRQVAAISK